MSPKVAKAGKAEKNVAPKAAKAEKKGAGKSAKAADPKELEAAAPAEVDQDELDEQQDEAAASSSGGGNAEALAAAAAGGPAESSASFKNFRHHPDMENFYRFIYENDLRHEALAIIDEMAVQKHTRKIVKGARAQAH